MKVIFLDIDGVLVTGDYWKQLELENKTARDEDHHHLFSPSCVANLEKLIEETDAKIIVSSTWRWLGEDKLIEIFKRRGVTGDIIGITSLERMKENGIYSGESRGRQIQEYIEENKDDIENYVIIDDDSDMLDSQLDNFVHTTFDSGFNTIALEQALEILKK
jgi:hypothetical protein